MAKKKTTTPRAKKPTPTIFEEVVHVEEIEALKFAKMDAEIRNAQQAMRLADFEIDKARRDFEMRVREQQSLKTSNENIIKMLRPAYEELVKAIATKYDIDVAHVIIDPDTLIIRDGSKN